KKKKKEKKRKKKKKNVKKNKKREKKKVKKFAKKGICALKTWKECVGHTHEQLTKGFQSLVFIKERKNSLNYFVWLLNVYRQVPTNNIDYTVVEIGTNFYGPLGEQWIANLNRSNHCKAPVRQFPITGFVKEKKVVCGIVELGYEFFFASRKSAISPLVCVGYLHILCSNEKY
ncbi:hypothetical protein RFI_39936, partial [Reticulomyxa filosa]